MSLQSGLDRVNSWQFCGLYQTERSSQFAGGQAAVQRDLGRLEKWADRNPMTSSTGKCKVLCLGRNNPIHQCRLGLTGWGAALKKRIWGPGGKQVGHEPAACRVVSAGGASRSREVCLPLCSALGGHIQSTGFIFRLRSRGKTWTCWCEPSKGPSVEKV